MNGAALVVEMRGVSGGGGNCFVFVFRFFMLFFLLASFEPLSFNSCSVQATLLRMDYYRLRFS